MLQVIIGFVIIAFMLIFDRKMIEFKIDKVTKFLTFMVIITAIRVAMSSFKGDLPSGLYNNIPFWAYAIVPWEDAFYVAPMLYLQDLEQKSKWLWWALVGALSIHFGLGHAYQGIMGVILTSFYPYFISFKYSKRVGLGTVMVCHVLYDMITVLTAKYSWIVDL